MIDAKYLDEIKEREQAATSGPWEVKVKGNTVESHQVMSQGNEPICSAISPKTKNAQFIAHARTDIPALISEVERLTSENTALQSANGKLENQLAESQRREQAAVDDLEGAGACFTCKHFRRNGGDCFGAGKCRVDGVEIFPCNEPGVYRVEVPDDGRDTYEWRGPQETGKGETE